MTILKAIILGVLQGATEFLPVSSSGHLVLVPWLAGWHEVGESNLAFDALVHWGTLVAVLVYFWGDLWRIAKAMLAGISKRDLMAKPDARLGWYILVGSIPAGLAGLLLEDWFEQMFGNPLAAAILLFGTAGLLYFSERIATFERELDEMSWANAILIGCAQALAILPGISRSGATIAAGLKSGFSRAEAARYSFLLGLPAIVGAGSLQLVKLLRAGSLSGQLGILVAGFISAGVIGYLAIHSLLRYVRNHSLNLFAGYCILLGAISLAVYVIRL